VLPLYHRTTFTESPGLCIALSTYCDGISMCLPYRRHKIQTGKENFAGFVATSVKQYSAVICRKCARQSHG